MSYIKELRVTSKTSVIELARISNVSQETVRKMDKGFPVRDIQVVKVCEALSKLTGKDINWQDERIPRIS